MPETFLTLDKYGFIVKKHNRLIVAIQPPKINHWHSIMANYAYCSHSYRFDTCIVHLHSYIHLVLTTISHTYTALPHILDSPTAPTYCTTMMKVCVCTPRSVWPPWSCTPLVMSQMSSMYMCMINTAIRHICMGFIFLGKGVGIWYTSLKGTGTWLCLLQCS